MTTEPPEPDITTFRTDRTGIRKVLGDLEAEIMELIWARSPEKGVLVRDIFEPLYERRRLAYTTVMSTMTRLAKKRLLRTEKRDAAYVYYPVMSQQAFIESFVGRILEDLYVNFSGETFEHLKTLQSSQHASHMREQLDDILQQRAEEEEEPD
ncbi:BlaI/MecI/CopY family transcriptional regulator [Ktedonospora formicarum]|uniref:Penicillinase repressor n=1 Tax=Ktedonospora formicarum TaxID=2778364 RepID=A0A8J3MRA3_9CHLR|nr:BlaI/MecI/CopY family transcriptional regulator [Ktedonospora formicarum]GHO42080.1 penicillinase repressor [Ktedonospora formicarum]